MDISTLPGYADFVTALTTSPQFAEAWAEAQEEGLDANQFAAKRVITFMAQTAASAARAAFEKQNQIATDAVIAAATTQILSQSDSKSQPEPPSAQENVAP